MQPLVQKKYRYDFTNIVCLFFAASFLLYFSIPRLTAEYWANSQNKVIAEIQSKNTTLRSQNQFRSINQYELSNWLAKYSERNRDKKISFLLSQYKTLKMTGVKEKQRAIQIREKVINEIKSALSMSPSQSNYWYLLSELVARRSDPGDLPNKYLRMSYFTGKYEGWVAVKRLKFVLQNWEYTQFDIQEFAKRDIKLLWNEKAFKNEVANIFTHLPFIGQKIIYQQINQNGYEHIENLTVLLKRKGYLKNNNLLYSIVQ